MKWFFLINNASFLSEFFGKLAHQAIEQGDECVVVISSKIAEYEKKKFFPDKSKFISKIDWCIKNYQKEKKEFNNLSWKELFPDFDRFKSLDFRYNNSFNMVSRNYQFFEFLFQEEKPDIVISESPAGLFHEVAYYLCNTNNIPYIGLGGSGFNNRISVNDSGFTSSKYEKTFNEIKDIDISKKEKEFAKNFIEKLISHEQLPYYVTCAKIRFTQFDIIKHYIKRTKELKNLFKYILNRKYFKDIDYESEVNLRRAILAIWKMEKRQFRISFQKSIFSKFINSDKNFFFFPLHYQSESSTSVWATYYCDQLNTIKNIAFALPFPYKLYVKEHPGSIGLRKKSFYKKLQKLPNVVLISSEENVEQIIEKSSAVIVLASTVGMEASLAGKIVYVLGNVSYSYHPLCKKVKDFKELKDKIKEDLINKPKIDHGDLENINCRFITSYLRNTIKGSLISASQEKDTNNYKLIYKILKFYVNSKTS